MTRGGLKGTLAPPHEPKTDLLYVWSDENGWLYRMTDDGVVPSNYGRGRKVEWVDVDNDGVNELYVGNALSANSLLVYDPQTAAYRDHASHFELGFTSAENFAWMDWDRDGFQDLVFMSAGRLALAHNLGGTRFEVLPGVDLGLVLPESGAPVSPSRYGKNTLHVLDFDNDGRLDLWMSGLEPDLTNHLFRRQEDHSFVDVTKQANLSSIVGTERLVLFDVDNDGFVDAVSMSDEILLLRNMQGTHFEPGRLDARWDLEKIARPVWTRSAVVAGDFDGDGRTDEGERNLVGN